MARIPDYAEITTSTTEALLWASVAANPANVNIAPVSSGTIHAIGDDHVFRLTYKDGSTSLRKIPAGQSLPIESPDVQTGAIIAIHAKAVTSAGTALFNPFRA